MAEKENPANNPQQGAHWAMLAFEHAYDPIFVHKRNPHGLSGQFVAVNEAACRRLGYTTEELLALSPHDIAAPKAVAQYPRIKEEASKQGNVVFESVQVTKDGKRITVENNAYLLDVDGETMVIIISRDISERKKAHDELEERVTKRTAELEKAGEALQAAAHQWQSTFDSIGDAVCILTPDFEILRCNEAMVAFVGKPRDQIVGRTCWNIVHGTSKPIENCPVMRMKETLRRETATFLMKDRWISVAVDPILDISGNLIGAVHVIADVTERKQAEEDMLRLNSAMAQASEGIIIADINTQIISYTNDAYARLLGYTAEQMIGMRFRDFNEGIITEKFEAQTLFEVLLDPATRTVEMKQIKKDGTVVPVLLSLAQLKRGDEELPEVIIVARDITERKRAEEALRESDRRITELIATIHNAVFVYRAEDNGKDFVFAEFNHAAEVMEGRLMEEVIGKRLSEISPMATESRLLSALQRVYRTGNPEHYPPSIYKSRTGGPDTWREVWVYRQSSGDVVAEYANVTEQKRAEEEIRKLARFPSENPNPVLRIDKDGTIIYANNASAALLEYWGCRSGEKLPESWAIQITDVIRSGKNSYFDIDYDGKTIALTLAPIVELNQVNIYGLDITERKQAEYAMQVSETRYRRLFESAKDGILILDYDTGMIVDVNPFLIEMLGYSHEQFLNKTLWDVGPFKDTIASRISFDKLQKEGYVRYEDLPLETKDGRHLAVEFVSNVYEVDSTKVIQCNIRDITDRKRVQEVLLDREELLNQVGDIAKIGGWEMDLISRTAVWTKGTYDIGELGYGEKVPGPDEHINWYLPQYRQMIAEAMDRLINNCEPIEFEAELKTAKGNVKWCKAYGRPQECVDGKCVKINGTFQDITEQKETEEEINKLSNAVEQSIDGVAISDLEPKLIFVNQAFAEIHGYTVDEMLGIKVENIHSKEQQREFKRRIVQIKKKGFWAGEIGHMRKDGSTFPTFMTTTLLKDNQGGPIGVLVFTRDITEQKQAEEALHSSEAKYENLVEQGNDGIIIIQNNLLKFVNTKMAEMGGYIRDELADKPFIEFVAPGYRELVVDRYKQRLAGIYVPSEYEVAILRKDGTEMPVEINASLTEYDGAPADMAIIRDITERKQAADKLKQYSENLENMVIERAQELADSEEKFRLIVNSTNDAIYVSQRGKDEQVRIIEVNRTISEMLGYSRREMRQMHPKELVSAKGLEMSMVKIKLLDEQEHIVYESEFSSKEGKKIPVEVGARLFMYKGLRTIVSVIRDITERKQSERMLDDTQQRLVRAEKLAAIGQLASGIAHELRNPLAVINNAAYYLKMKIGGEDKSVDKHLGIMEREVFRSSGIIAGLLDFARTREPRLEQVELSSFVGEIISKLSMPNGINLLFDNQAKDIKMAIDAEQIKRVLLNLISNAIQSMSSGGELSVQIRPNAGYVELDVSDTGDGIEKKYHSKIFEPLFTTRAEKGGTGIGLSICKSVVDAHHGTIKLKSQVGKGTTFTIKLPIKKV